MAKLVVTRDIEEELDELDKTHPDTVDAAELLLNELYDNLDLLEGLHNPNTYPLHTPSFEIKIFQEAHDDGYNIYILKFLDLEGFRTDHRILIGFNSQRDVYYALAITDRDYSYCTNHSAYGELLDRYENCRIPKIPRRR